MKNICLGLIILCLIMFPFAVMGNLLNCNMDRAKLTAVITADKRIEPVELFEELLNDAVKSIRTDAAYDNLILFVHGRGQHPCHAFDKSLIYDLESDYSAKVIMYHWPSWQGMFVFPDTNARKAAVDFKTVISTVADYRNNNKDLVKDIKFTLLTHSMGSIVLEKFMLNKGGHLVSGAFDTVVINASASSGEKHAEWVGKIGFAEHVYITINQADPTLGKAEFYEEFRSRDMKFRLLGKSLASKKGVDYSLADNAKYIDLTRLSLRHVYYIHRYLKDKPALKFFYDRALNGLPAMLDKEHGVIKVEREQVYTLGKRVGSI